MTEGRDWHWKDFDSGGKLTLFLLHHRSSNYYPNSAKELSELRSCVKVEVDVLGPPSLISLRFLWT